MQPLAEKRYGRHPLDGSRRKLPLPRTRLPLPVADDVRIAQLSPRELLFTNCPYLSLELGAALQEYEPRALVASTSELEMLAGLVREQGLPLSCVDMALFVITDCRDVPLRDATRQTLWRVFGVPTYELLLSADGLPIASECDAHEGWHVEKGVTFSSVNGELWFQNRREMPQGTGLTGHLEETLCPCARPGIRILNATIDYRDAVRHQLAQTA